MLIRFQMVVLLVSLMAATLSPVLAKAAETPPPKLRILFMCVANSARSQMAEGWARKLLPANVEIHSSGSRPSHLNPYAVKAMGEVGVDISKQYSKSTEQLPQDFIDKVDYVVTLCQEEVCPTIVSKAKQLHWAMPDPASKDPLPKEELMKRFRVARDAIKGRIENFQKTTLK